MLPKVWEIIVFAWNLNKINDWQDPDNEPFITNCSAFNAIICWYFYLA
jgi:hypothetical protein